MRRKRRNALLISLFDPLSQVPQPGAAALEEVRGLLKLLMLHLAAPPETDEAEPSSSLDHNGQKG